MAFGWPRYEPMVFSTAVNVSSKNLDTLNQAGLPKRFLGGGTTLEEPLGVDVPGLGYLIKFAQGYLQGFYYEPATGGVWWTYDRPGPEPRLVNSSLEQFTRTVQAIIDAFPFSEGVDKEIEDRRWDDDERITTEERDIAQRNATAAKLRDRIREIDPAAMAPHSFWEDFTTDVEIGDYATADVVSEDDTRYTSEP